MVPGVFELDMSRPAQKLSPHHPCRHPGSTPSARGAPPDPSARRLPAYLVHHARRPR
jgi:hypothetical protein